ncbi:MAG: hypothetical protein CSYNP_04061 [Syntrophus sp. SKADARSKE-3]|nr:hypothetical protein [Syntrophus sp. SKADARSKE-3]
MKHIFVLVCMVLFLVTFSSVNYAAANRFVDNKDGTVTDKQTGLIWTDKDNGKNSDWLSAYGYCDEYTGGGKSDWRMPTINELMQLYASGAYGSIIKRSGDCVWSSTVNGSDTAYFCFNDGKQYWAHQAGIAVGRTLPVRSGQLIDWLMGHLVIWSFVFLVSWFFFRQKSNLDRHKVHFK